MDRRFEEFSAAGLAEVFEAHYVSLGQKIVNKDRKTRNKSNQISTRINKTLWNTLRVGTIARILKPSLSWKIVLGFGAAFPCVVRKYTPDGNALAVAPVFDKIVVGIVAPCAFHGQLGHTFSQG